MSEIERQHDSVLPLEPATLQPESRSQWPDTMSLSQRKVLGAVSVGLSLTRASTLAGVSMPSVQRWRRDKDESFREALDEARERGTQYLEDAALERATDYERPSDALLMFLLKSRRPEVYRERVDVRASGKVERVKRIVLEADVREAMAVPVEALQSIAIEAMSDLDPGGGTPRAEAV